MNQTWQCPDVALNPIIIPWMDRGLRILAVPQRQNKIHPKKLQILISDLSAQGITCLSNLLRKAVQIT